MCVREREREKEREREEKREKGEERERCAVDSDVSSSSRRERRVDCACVGSHPHLVPPLPPPPSVCYSRFIEGICVVAIYKAPNPYIPLHKKLEAIMVNVAESVRKKRGKMKKVTGANMLGTVLE